MSYGLKYKIELTNKKNKLVEIELHEKDYTGSWVYLDSGATAPELVPDLSDHFRGTSLLFSVEATDDAGMPEFFVEDPRRYKVVMKHSGVVEFIGFLVPEVYEDPYIAAPFDIELTATDGLGLLKNIDFDLTGYHSDIACIDHILRKTGHELPVSVAVDVQYLGQPTMTLPAMAYAHTNTAKFYSDKGDPDNCYDALKKILASYGLELYVTQWRNRWLVFRTIDLQGEFVTFTNAVYTSRGSLFAASNFGKNQPCDAVGSLNRSLNKRLHKVHISNKLGRKDSVLPLDVFEQELVRTFNRSNNRGGVTYMYNAKNWKWVGNAANDTTQWRWDYLRGALAFVVFPPYTNNNLLNYIYYQSPQLAASGQPWVAAFDLQMERGVDNGGAVNIPVDVQHVAGSTVRYLTESGWSSSPNPLKIEMTNQTVFRGFQTPLPSGQYRILLPSIPSGGYIRFRLFRPAEHSSQYYAFSIRNLTLFEDLTTSPVPEFVNYDAKISENVVNSEKIEVEGSAPEYPNSHLLFTNVKMSPSMTSAPYDWIHKGDTSRIYPLAVVQMREIASNNRKPRQILSGRIDGVVASLAIIRDKTVPEEPLFWFKSGSWDLWNDAMEGTFEQLLPYQEQDLTISQMSVTENFSSSNSNNANAAQASAQTSSGRTAGTSSRSSFSWVNITGKPETFPPSAHTHKVSDVTGLQSALDAKAKKEGDITQDFHVKDLHIAGQVNQWLAQQLVVDDARIQVNRRQGGATVDSGLVIYNKDTSTEVSSLVYDVDGIWRAGGQRIFTDAYNPTLGGVPAADYALKTWVENSATAYNAARLGGYSAASYPRKAEPAVITGSWEYTHFIQAGGLKIGAGHESWADVSIKLKNPRAIHIVSDGATSTNAMLRVDSGAGINLFRIQENGNVGFGIAPTERLHVAGNGLFTGNLTTQGNLSAVNAALSGTLGVTGASTLTGAVTAKSYIGSEAWVSGFAGSGTWRLEGGSETHLTVDRLTVRGRMDVYEMVINQIRATNGSLWVSDGEKVDTASKHPNPDEYRIFPDTDNGKKPLKFRLRDIIRAQKWDGRNIIFITARVSYLHSNGYNIRMDGFGGWRGDPSELVGLEFVRIGNTSSSSGRQGALYLTSSDDGSPYLDVLDGVDSASFTTPRNIRYIRDWLNGSTSNTGNHWIEIQALNNAGTNVALNKTVTSSGNVTGGAKVVDGVTTSGSSDYASGGNGQVSVTVDLGSVQEIDKVKVWHYYADGRTYNNTRTEVSADGVTWYSIFDSILEGTYPETSSGRTYQLGANKTKVRLGRLNGINNLTGYGLYGENTFLTGKLLVGDLTKAGQYMEYENGQLNIKGQITVTGGNAATKEDVDAVQVGGRNLYFKSGFSSGTSGNAITGWGSYGPTLLQIESDKPFAAPGVNAVSWVISSGVSNGGYYQRLRSPDGASVVDYFQQGQKYTVSAWLKASAPGTLRIMAEGVPGGTAVLSLTTEWQLYTHTFVGDSSRHTVAFYGYTQGVRYYLCMPKLELGNRATDWTPAPEDVPSALDYLAKAIQDGTTDIEGGLVTTNVLMVKDTNGAVRGGMSGLKSDNVGFWTGGTYQDAISNSANVIFRKDGSFSLAGGKISGTAAGALSVDGGVVTGLIESQNWDGIEGSRLNLLDGSLEFGNTIKVDSFAKEIIVKDGATQNTGVRIGDFLLSPTSGGAGALDMDLSGSRTIAPDSGYSLSGQLTYINSGGVLTPSSLDISTNLTAGNNYTFQTNINLRIARGNLMGSESDANPPPAPTNSISIRNGYPMIRVMLFSGATKVGEQMFYIGEKLAGNVTFFDMSLDVNIVFNAASNNLRVQIDQVGGDVMWVERRWNGLPTTRFSQVTLTFSEFDATSKVRIIPSAAITELSAKGFLSLWGPQKYFRIYDRAGVTNFIEARGVQEFISPNGNYRLRISDTGIEKKVGFAPWAPL